MTSVALLVVLLVVLGGHHRLRGRSLGTWVGRRRLTVFGARPKLTGQIVGVGAGILIMLTTLGVLALAFTNATQTLVNAQRTADEFANLRAQERLLQAQLSDVRSDLSGLQDDLLEARAVIDQAQSERATALPSETPPPPSAMRAEPSAMSWSPRSTQTQAQLADVSSGCLRAPAPISRRSRPSATVPTRSDSRPSPSVTPRSPTHAAARAEAETLEAEAPPAPRRSTLANVRLLELQVLLAEADANVGAAVERLGEAERATAEAAPGGRGRGGPCAGERATRPRPIATPLSAEADELRDTAAVLAEQLEAVAAEVATLEATAARLGAEAQALQQENVGLAARNEQLARTNADLAQRNDVLAQLNTSACKRRSSPATSWSEPPGAGRGLTDRLEEESRRLSRCSRSSAASPRARSRSSGTRSSTRVRSTPTTRPRCARSSPSSCVAPAPPPRGRAPARWSSRQRSSTAWSRSSARPRAPTWCG
jgi:hypothetical protein